MIPAIREDLVRFVNGAKQSDDLTMLAIRYQTNAIIMRNDIQQIPTLAEWIDGLEIPAELNMQVNLALEEAVSNVMLYAYPDTNSGQVFVEFVRLDDAEGSQIIFTISDSGIPFDPTQKPPVDTTLSAEERSIGGLGIHLVRQLMDKVEYKRQEDKNILTLTKKIIKND
jgi:sigma-B regulation protein RsbU (phosphoserine phosphatase)